MMKKNFQVMVAGNVSKKRKTSEQREMICSDKVISVCDGSKSKFVRTTFLIQVVRINYHRTYLYLVIFSPFFTFLSDTCTPVNINKIRLDINNINIQHRRCISFLFKD